MLKEKVKVEESAKKFVEATSEVIDVFNENMALGGFTDIDPKTIELLQATINIISSFLESYLTLAEVIDQHTDMIHELRSEIKCMDRKLDSRTIAGR